MKTNEQDRIINRANGQNLTIQLHQPIDEQRDTSFWYKGLLAEFTDNTNNQKYLLATVDDVIAHFYKDRLDKKTATVTENESFKEKMAPFIETDDDLLAYAENYTSYGKETAFPRLNLARSNNFMLFEGSLDDTYPIDLLELCYTYALDSAIDAIVRNRESIAHKKARADRMNNLTYMESTQMLTRIVQRINELSNNEDEVTIDELVKIATTYGTGVKVHRMLNDVLVAEDELILEGEKMINVINDVTKDVMDDPDEHKTITYLINEHLNNNQ